MTEIRIDLDQDGIRQLMQGPEVTADIERRVHAIADAAGEGMAYRVYLGAVDRHGQQRVRGEVWTDTVPARVAEAQDRALTRALDAGRG